ncbi:copper resistance protein CopC [Rhizobium gallicum]|uniref:copper resistance protein CopC n=1 Tax=Rhizobium gallicum TaxID=56730 RepID=UPI003B8A86FD
MDESYAFHANVTLTFAEPIDAPRSTAHLFGPTGEVAVGSPEQGANRGELVIPLRANLAPGAYRVEFIAVARSGRRLVGQSSIVIPEPGIARQPSASVSISATP